jgi:hypothetical protein
VNAVLQDQPLPARLLPWPRALDTTLGRCLLLAALLHLWLVALLGNAPGGSAPPGQGVAGVLNITLRGPPREGATEPVVPAEALNRAPGVAPTPRWGGTVRQTEPAPDSLPGAARLGLPAAQQPDAVPAPPQPPQPTPAQATPPPPAAALPAPLQPAPLQPTPSQPAPPAEPAAPPESHLRAVAPLPAPAVVAPALASEAPLPAAAALPDLPPPATAVPLLQRQLASPLTRPAAAAAPSLPATGVEAVTLPAPPAALPPAIADAPPSLRQLQARPPEARRAAEPALPRSPQVPEVPSAAVPAPAPVLSPALSPMPALTDATGAPGAPGAPLPAVGSAAPDAGTRVGQDVATPAAAASAPPRLNLQLARPRGAELSRYDTRGALPVLPRPPERDEKLAREIEKAGKADCRKAYGGMGPLAVIPLAVDALRKEGGCKW